MTDTPEKTPSKRELRVGFSRATNWENESDGGSFFSVTFSRLFRTDDGWRSTGSFGLNDLPHLAMLAHRVHQAVDELTPDSREYFILERATLGATIRMSIRHPPFRSYFRSRLEPIV